MKRTIVITILILSVVLLGHARDKEPIVYDHVGKITLSPIHYDASATITTQYGTASAFCDMTATSINCTDTPAGDVVDLGNNYRGSLKLQNEGGTLYVKDCPIASDKVHYICDPIDGLHWELILHKRPEMLKKRAAAREAASEAMIPCLKTRSCSVEDWSAAKAAAEEEIPPAEVTFKYRLVAGKIISGYQQYLYCLPFETTDKKGRIKEREACYPAVKLNEAAR